VSDVSIAFYDRNNNLINVDKPSSIFANNPYGFGLTSPYDKLKIWFEFIGVAYYYIHTVEVHNPNNCNLKDMSSKRYEDENKPLENYLFSITLNNRAVIDYEYLKMMNQTIFDNFDEFYFFELNFLSTKNGKNPSDCSLRVFAETYL
jgi:hypothetical protein